MYAEAGDHRKALACFTKAIETDPGFMPAYLGRGVSRLDLKEYALAREDFSIVIAARPQAMEARLHRAYAFEQDGLLHEAVADYLRAGELGSHIAYFRLASVYKDRDEYDQSIAMFGKAIELKPDYYPAYYNRGNIHIVLRRTERAIEDYTQALRINPNHLSSYINRGNAYKQVGSYGKALADYERAISIDSGCVEAYYARGKTYAIMGRHHEACEEYDRALDLKPEYIKALIGRGVARKQRGMVDEAIEDLTRALELDGQNDLAYSYRGLTFEKNGEYEKALADLRAALRIKPNHYETRLNVGRVLEHLGLTDEALAMYQQVVSETSDSKPGRGCSYHYRALSAIERLKSAR